MLITNSPMHKAGVSLEEIRSLKAFLMNTKEKNRLLLLKPTIDSVTSSKKTKPNFQKHPPADMNRRVERIGLSPILVAKSPSKEVYLNLRSTAQMDLSPHSKNSHFIKNDFQANHNHMSRLRQKYNLPSHSSNQFFADRHTRFERQSDSQAKASSASRIALEYSSPRPECHPSTSAVRRLDFEKIEPPLRHRKLQRQKTSPQMGEDQGSPE